MDFQGISFLEACSYGDISEVKKLLGQGIDVNFQDKEGNNGLIKAISSGSLDICHILVDNQIAVDSYNNEGQTALFYAVQQEKKDIILFLLLSGANPHHQNNQQQSVLDLYQDQRGFINSILAEEKAFKVLDTQKVKHLKNIFDEIDFDGQKCITIEKSIKFNKYIDESVNDTFAEKDAKDFISSCAIINKQTVNIDEWVFAFSKTYAVDEQAYEKFMSDYEKALESKGRFKNLQQQQVE